MRTLATAPTSAPPSAEAGFLRRNLRRAIGLALLAALTATVVALATWSVEDPSLGHASFGDVHNLLGYAGASLADFLIQMFGVAVVALLAPPALWALRLAAGHPAKLTRRRLAAWLIAAALLCGAATALAPPATWPLPTGLGGVAGDRVALVPHAIAGSLFGAGSIVAEVMLGVLGLALLVFASGWPAPAEPAPEAVPDPLAVRRTLRREAGPVPVADEDDDDRPGLLAMLRGAAAHWRLTITAWVSRLLARRRREEEDDGFDDMGIEVPAGVRREPAMPRARTEPRFGGEDRPPLRIEPAYTPGGRAAADDGFDDEDEEPPFDEALIDEMDPGDFEPAPEPAIVRRTAPAAAAPAPTPTVGGRVAAPAPPPKQGRRAAREAQPSLLKEGPFELPPVRLLAEPKPMAKNPQIDTAALENNARMLEGVLEDFGVRGQIVNVRPGPVVTLYELEPAPGIKSSRVIGLADDIARSMSAVSARVAVIPGKNAIGIELPNLKRETVFLRELVASAEFEKTKQKLALCLGKTIGGEPVIADLARMPHLLVAGTTGSGKSVAINTFLVSLLYRMTPDQCRLIMVDPKMLELSVYDGIPHLLAPVVTDPKKAVVALKWTVREMEERYRKMSKLGVRNIDGFNARVAEAAEKGEVLSRIVQTGFDRDSGEPIFEEEEIASEAMPFIVVIIDEMADLMMVAGKDIEGAVQRLAQMARAAGIHIITATQRPSVDVITGTIKANFPTRISFQVTSKIDSRTILGEMGAEQLLGQGDMLYMAGGGRIQRVHGPFVSDQEVEAIVAHLKTQGSPDYLDQITIGEDDEDGEGGGAAGGLDGLEDSADLYDRAVAVVLRDRKASTSYVQRRLQIGYNRAASIVERMEREGIVGPANHAGKREILVGGDSEAA
jgi:S-DNA-T family DNA segregation ATPase FtsK/SpoIIIE